MSPRNYYLQLSKDGRLRFANRSGVATGTLDNHIFPRRSPKPRRPVGMRVALAIADASDGFVSRREALEYFEKNCYPGPVRGARVSCELDAAGA